MQVKGEATTNQLPVRATHSLNNNSRGAISVNNSQYGGGAQQQQEESGYPISGVPIKKKVDIQSRHLGYNSTTVGTTLKHSKTDLAADKTQAGYLNGVARTGHNSVVQSRKQTTRLPPAYSKKGTEATDSCERLHNMSRG